MDRTIEALEFPAYELLIKDSPAVERAVSKFEVLERLKQKVLDRGGMCQGTVGQSVL